MRTLQDCGRIEVFHEGEWVYAHMEQLELGDITRFITKGSVVLEGHIVIECAGYTTVGNKALLLPTRLTEQRETYLRENKWLQEMISPGDSNGINNI